MTEDEYFSSHIPHRVNLLSTFRERYSPSGSRREFPFGEPRDFFRCSKDISILMVRFFCDELGLYLPKNATDLKERTPMPNRGFKVRPFTKLEVAGDSRYGSLLAVLRAANRAVAHIECSEVDHPFKVEKDHEMLFEVITWIEDVIQSHMYAPNHLRLTDAMKHPSNQM